MKHLYEVTEYTPYSNEDKIFIYKKVLKFILEDIKQNDVHGFCHYMIRSCHYLKAMQSVAINRKGFWSDEHIDDSPFPELMKFKPNNTVNSHGEFGGVFWFALDPMGMAKRISIVTEILNDLKAKS